MRVDLDVLETLEKAATPGRWETSRGGNGWNDWSNIVAPTRVIAKDPYDGEFIAATRNALPAIIAELRAARGCVAVLRFLRDGRHMGPSEAADFSLEDYDEATKGDG